LPAKALKAGNANCTSSSDNPKASNATSSDSPRN
jgi:hypothetical protein